MLVGCTITPDLFMFKSILPFSQLGSALILICVEKPWNEFLIHLALQCVNKSEYEKLVAVSL